MLGQGWAQDFSTFIMGMILADKSTRDSRHDGCERLVVVMTLHRGLETCHPINSLEIKMARPLLTLVISQGIL